MNQTIIRNYTENRTYCPYCLRCSALVRMRLVVPYFWDHHCGAECDLREEAAKYLKTVHVVTILPHLRMFHD